MVNSAPRKLSADSRSTATIVEWNAERGFGFVQHGAVRLFLHIRDFSVRRKQPAIGDVVHFKIGCDAQGRPCAVDAIHREPGSQLTLSSFLLFGLLMVLPALALRKFPVYWRGVASYLAIISVITIWAYYHDKQRALSQGWRIRESTLHLLEAIGGWPSAFLAQRWFRHKTSKRSYKAVFWLIVILQQFAAFDSLQDWKSSSTALAFTGEFCKSVLLKRYQPREHRQYLDH